MKQNWKNAKFGDVVRLCKDRSSDPLADGIERYVAIEHIEPEDLRIRSWGLVEDGTTFTQRFKAGQTLFVKRRAYQRKVAVADFEGVCSGDIYVLEPKNDRLLPELLPFLCQTDAFFHHAVNTSAGSLSPRTNWTQLAQYEFALPPLAEQQRIAGVLWAANKVSLAYQDLLEAAQILLESMVEQDCWTDNRSDRQPLVSLVKNTTTTLIDGDWIESKDMSSSGVRLIQLADIGIGEFLDRSNKYISQETYRRIGCTELLPNDILISRMADPTGRACLIPDLHTHLITAVDCAIVRLDPLEHNKRYWLYVLNSKSWFREIQRFTAGSTRERISRKNLESIHLPVPAKSKQDSLEEKFNAVSSIINATKEKIRILGCVQKEILNRFL